MNRKDRDELRRAQKKLNEAGGEEHVRQQLDEAVRGMESAMNEQAARELEKFRFVMDRGAERLLEALRPVVDQLSSQMLAAYEDWIAEWSRQLEALAAAQMAALQLPRMEIFRPTLDPLIGQIPYHPRPAPAPQPSAPPAREQDVMEQVFLGVLITVISTLLVQAINWYAQTGVWVFEQLVVYLFQQLD